jgi:hypothetical protein
MKWVMSNPFLLMKLINQELYPTQQSLEWGWINQWYQGTKIGPDIYHIKPYKLLNYCPIIGTTYEVKNTEAKSLSRSNETFPSNL